MKMKQVTKEENVEAPIDQFNRHFDFVKSFVNVAAAIDQNEFPVDLTPLAYEALEKLDEMKAAVEQIHHG